MENEKLCEACEDIYGLRTKGEQRQIDNWSVVLCDRHYGQTLEVRRVLLAKSEGME